MSEYIILQETPFSQEAWVEERDAKGRLMRLSRPARDERLITIRRDRQYTAKLRLAKVKATGTKRHANITTALAKVHLGEEIKPGVRVVEYEESLTEAREAIVTPEERDEKGKLIKEESYSPPTPEIIEHRFALRLNERDLVKVSLNDSEFKQTNWKTMLATKAPALERWEM